MNGPGIASNGETMKRFPIAKFLMLIIPLMLACGTQTATPTGDFVATAFANTHIAETSFAEQVALTIAALPTNTPRPTLTHTPLPTFTNVPTRTSTRIPTKPYVPPTATPCSGETVSISIKNDTGGQVTLYLTGPCAYTFYLNVGDSTIYVIPGNYSYTAYGCGGATLSGSKSLSYGDEWTWFCQ
jgi:hypothetical protein